MPFRNRKTYFRGSFQFSIVTISKIPTLWGPEIQLFRHSPRSWKLLILMGKILLISLQLYSLQILLAVKRVGLCKAHLDIPVDRWHLTSGRIATDPPHQSKHLRLIQASKLSPVDLTGRRLRWVGRAKKKVVPTPKTSEARKMKWCLRQKVAIGTDAASHPIVPAAAAPLRLSGRHPVLRQVADEDESPAAVAVPVPRRGGAPGRRGAARKRGVRTHLTTKVTGRFRRNDFK